MKALFVFSTILALSSCQNSPSFDPRDIPWKPFPPGQQGDTNSQLVQLISMMGQVFNETQRRGGRLGGMGGDLADELRDVVDRSAGGDIIESFADFLQIANEHLGSLGVNVQYDIEAIVGVLKEIKSLSESGRAPGSDLIDRYRTLLLEPLQAVFGGGRQTPGLDTENIGPNRKPARRASGCNDMRSIFPEMADSLDSALRQSRGSVGALVENIGPGGLPMACVKELLNQLTPGQCNQDHIRRVLCRVEADPDILQGFLNCLNTEDVCRTLELIKTTECVTLSPNHGSLAGMLLSHGCDDAYMTVDVLSSAPLSVLQRYVETLHSSDLMKLLREFKDDAPLLDEMTCDKREYLARTAEKVLTGANRTDHKERLVRWKESMEELVDGLYSNNQRPSPSEVANNLRNKLNELSGLLSAAEGTRTALPDFEAIVTRIRNALETARNPSDVNIREMLSPVDTLVRTVESRTDGATEVLTNFLENMKPLLPYMSRDFCSRLSVGMIRDHLEDLGSEEFKCSVLKNKKSCENDGECGRAIVQTLLKENTVDLTDPEGRDMLGSLLDCIPTQELKETVQPGNCAHFEAGLTPTGFIGRQLAERCLPENTDLLYMDQSDIMNMGCLITQLDLVSLRQIPEEIICSSESLPGVVECLATMRNVDSSVVQLLSRRCSSGQLPQDVVSSLGPTLVQAPQETLRRLRRQDLSDPTIRESVLEGIQQICAEGQRDCLVKARIMREKIDDLTTATKQESLMKTMTLNQFRESINSDEGFEAVEDFLNLDEGNDPSGLQTSQRKLVVRMFLEKYDSPRQISENKILELGSLVLGFGSDLMLQLDPFSRLRLVQKFASFDGWQNQQVEALRVMLKNGLSDDDENHPWSRFTPSMIQNMEPNTLLGLIPEDLDEMMNETCNAVCRKLNAASRFYDYTSPSKAKETAQVCLKCLNILGYELTEEVVKSLGQTTIITLDDESILDRIPDDVVMKTANMFQDFSHMKDSFVKKLTSRIREAVAKRLENEGEDANYQDIVEDLGIWALILNQETRAKLQEALVNNIDAMREVLRINKNKHVSVGTRQLLSTLRQSLLHLVEDSVTRGSFPVRRRKRESSWVPKCVDLNTMGDASLELTVDQILSMSSIEVDNCMAMVGSIDQWSQEQYQAWFDKIIQVIGPVCTMSSDHLQRIGTVAYMISVDDIECLQNLDDDAVTSLGALSQWDENQMTAFATRYIQQANLPSPSKLTADHVVRMGHFLCGLSAEDIMIIPNEVYEKTSSLIGGLQNCGHDQLQALAHHAELLYGDASLWDGAVYADVGIVIGGLDGKDLAAATYPEIEVWTANAINHIKPEALKQLTTDQLSWLSRPQVLALSEDQKAVLGKEAKDALDNTVNPQNEVVKAASDATRLQIGSVLVLSIVAAYIRSI